MASVGNPSRSEDEESGGEDSRSSVVLRRTCDSRVASWGRESAIPPPARSATRSIAFVQRERPRSPPAPADADDSAGGYSVDAKTTIFRPRPRLPPPLPVVTTPAARTTAVQDPAPRPPCVPPPLVRPPAASQPDPSEDEEPATDPSPSLPSEDVVFEHRPPRLRRLWSWSIGLGVVAALGWGAFQLVGRQPDAMQPKFDGAMRALASSLASGAYPGVDAALGCAPPAALDMTAEKETKLRGSSKAASGGTRAARRGRPEEAGPGASSPDTSSPSESASGRYEPEGP